MESPARVDRSGALLKFGFYVFIVVIALPLFGWILMAAGYLVAAAGGVFAAGIAANALSLRIFERATLTAIGLGWGAGQARNALIGFFAGVGGAAAVTLLPAALGLATFEPDPESPAALAGFLFVSVMLLLGAIGEEVIFRGYGFQILLPVIGVAATLALSSVAFGAVHAGNLNVAPLGLVNTVGFGIILGYAFLRTGDLWLPIGLHFGWNWLLPLAGVHLSGLKIGVTGYVLRWHVSDLWSGGAYGPEAGLPTSLVIVTLAVFLWKAPVQRSQPPLLAAHQEEV